MREDFIIDDDEDDYNNCAQSDLTKLAVYYPYLSALDQATFNFSIKDKFMSEEIKIGYNKQKLE